MIQKKKKKKKEEEGAIAPWRHPCFVVVFFLFSFSVCFFFFQSNNGSFGSFFLIGRFLGLKELRFEVFSVEPYCPSGFNNYLIIQHLIFDLLFANMNDIINDIIREQQLFVGIQFCFNIYGKIMHWPSGWGPCWV